MQTNELGRKLWQRFKSKIESIEGREITVDDLMYIDVVNLEPVTDIITFDKEIEMTFEYELFDEADQ